jgi:hypothetical protein
MLLACLIVESVIAARDRDRNIVIKLIPTRGMYQISCKMPQKPASNATNEHNCDAKTADYAAVIRRQ